MKKKKCSHESKLQKVLFADLFRKIEELETLIVKKIEDVKKEEENKKRIPILKGK